ncbi:hypothetical protein [Parachlamydia acanthamoebae]|uniref:Uncharacterized protein n=1 Tax=Parachlamydia acanthamoebae TaxID=83552 RepID=A0A0C1EA64_9BACT|nr:hypothetical protein [Parachlamydia acanthamoebae]KIA78022.1 hypothetical protein DB43_FD00110 [Parachlamydia acanthamoebae]
MNLNMCDQLLTIYAGWDGKAYQGSTTHDLNEVESVLLREIYDKSAILDKTAKAIDCFVMGNILLRDGMNEHYVLAFLIFDNELKSFISKDKLLHRSIEGWIRLNKFARIVTDESENVSKIFLSDRSEIFNNTTRIIAFVRCFLTENTMIMGNRLVGFQVRKLGDVDFNEQILASMDQEDVVAYKIHLREELRLVNQPKVQKRCCVLF